MLYVAFDALSASAGCLLQFYQPGLSLSWAVGILLERFLAAFLDLKCQTCSVFHPWSKKADLEKTKEMENYTGKSKNATVVSTHYLYLSLQFYRSLTISTSRITAMKSVGKNIILRKYWRQIRTTTLYMIAEQTFAWLSRYKKIVCSMDKLHHLFFLHRIVSRRNKYTHLCISTGRKVLLPKSKQKTKRYWFYCDCMPFTFRLHNMLAYIICTSIPIHYNTSQAQCFSTEL